MPTSLRLSRATLALMLAAALLAVIPAAPAFSDTADTAGTFEGTATLDQGISAPCTPGDNIHDGSFDGFFEGAHGTDAVVGTITADFMYCNSTTIAGTAEGSFTVSATVGSVADHTCDFEWDRTGAVAIITIDASGDCPEGGSATAAFAPTSAPGAVPGTAAVTGEGSWS